MKPLLFIVVAGVCSLLLAAPLAAQTTETVTLTGILIQGTADGQPLPDQMPVVLQIFTPDGELLESHNTLSAADNSFRFEGIPQYADNFYAFLATWAGIEQTSLPYKLAEVPDPIEFALYETTESLNDVVGSGGTLRIEFDEIDSLGAKVLLELNYVNLGDRIVYQGEQPIFAVELPVGAVGMAIEDSVSSNRLQTVNRVNDTPIPGVVDTQPLVPNALNVMRISFFVPYADGAVVDMRFPFAVSNFDIAVRSDEVALTSPLFAASEDAQTSSGRVYEIYNQTTPLSPDEAFIFTLSGVPASSIPQPLDDDSGETSASLIITIVLAALLIFGGLMTWLFRMRKPVESDL